MIGTYEIIYADPPWRYSAKKVQGAAENHYPTMSIDELCALPVAELAAKDSALFMVKPHARMSRKASGSCGNVAHMKRALSLAASSATGSAHNSSMLMVG